MENFLLLTNKDGTAMSASSSPPMWILSQEGAQEEQCLPSGSFHSPGGAPRSCCGEGMWKAQDGPQVAEVLMNGMVSVSPDACTFPYTEKLQIP